MKLVICCFSLSLNPSVVHSFSIFLMLLCGIGVIERAKVLAVCLLKLERDVKACCRLKCGLIRRSANSSCCLANHAAMLSTFESGSGCLFNIVLRLFITGSSRSCCWLSSICCNKFSSCGWSSGKPSSPILPSSMSGGGGVGELGGRDSSGGSSSSSSSSSVGGVGDGVGMSPEGSLPPACQLSQVTLLNVL